MNMPVVGNKFSRFSSVYNVRKRVCDNPLDKLTPLHRYVISEIRRSRLHAITFERFMQISLYHPKLGYYSGGNVKIYGNSDGHQSHFTTHPETFYPFYSYGIAEKFVEMWDCMGNPSDLPVVEMGAGNGRMAKGILDYLKKYCPELYKQVRYNIVELSPVLRNIQKINCAEHNLFHINQSAINFPFSNLNGIIISNELPDVFPVHLVLCHSSPRELYLTENDGVLEEILGPISDSDIYKYMKRADSVSHNRIEVVNTNMMRWAQNLAKGLDRGYIITIDYSRKFGQIAHHERPDIIRCFGEAGGRESRKDAYSKVGELDMTSDLHSDVYMKILEAAGLVTEFIGNETEFIGSTGRITGFLGGFSAIVSSRNVENRRSGNTSTRFIVVGMGKDNKLYPEAFDQVLYLFYPIAVNFWGKEARKSSLFRLGFEMMQAFELEPGVYDFKDINNSLRTKFPNFTHEELLRLSEAIREKINLKKEKKSSDSEKFEYVSNEEIVAEFPVDLLCQYLGKELAVYHSLLKMYLKPEEQYVEKIMTVATLNGEAFVEGLCRIADSKYSYKLANYLIKHKKISALVALMKNYYGFNGSNISLLSEDIRASLFDLVVKIMIEEIRGAIKDNLSLFCYGSVLELIDVALSVDNGLASKFMSLDEEQKKILKELILQCYGREHDSYKRAKCLAFLNVDK